MHIEENKPLAPLTTFGIGGPARWFVEAASEDEIVQATAWARERGLMLFVLGGGSNLLVSDAGFEGLVMRVGLLGIEQLPDEIPSGAEARTLHGGRDAKKDLPRCSRRRLGPLRGADCKR